MALGAALTVSASLGDLTKRQGFRNLQTDIRMGSMMIRHEDPGKVEISGQGQGAHFMLHNPGGPSQSTGAMDYVADSFS